MSENQTRRPIKNGDTGGFSFFDLEKSQFCPYLPLNGVETWHAHCLESWIYFKADPDFLTHFAFPHHSERLVFGIFSMEKFNIERCLTAYSRKIVNSWIVNNVTSSLDGIS